MPILNKFDALKEQQLHCQCILGQKIFALFTITSSISHAHFHTNTDMETLCWLNRYRSSLRPSSTQRAVAHIYSGHTVTLMPWCYLWAQASCWTWSGRKYGNSSLQPAETLLWIFPASLWRKIRWARTKSLLQQNTECVYCILTDKFQYQQKTVSLLYQSGFWWISPEKQKIKKLIEKTRWQISHVYK